MAENNQLGVFWGSDALYFVETSSLKPSQIFQIPFPKEKIINMDGGPFSPLGMELISGMQGALRQRDITLSSVNLALPVKDVIFRSFVIPWMQSSEIETAVKFEAVKYIPFSVDEIFFSFYPKTFVENGVKLNHIILVAIKKELLMNYTGILEQAALTVNVVESSAVSLIRSLMIKNHILMDQVTALVEIDKELGKIIVLSKGIPQFVREFRVSKEDREEGDHATQLAFVGALLNELRMSIDYFKRQNKWAQIEQIILLTESNIEQLDKSISDDLEITVKSLNSQSILEDASNRQMGFLNAYGVGAIDDEDVLGNFDLSPNKIRKHTLPGVEIAKEIHVKSLIPTALVCAGIFFLSFMLSLTLLNKQRIVLTKLNQELLVFQGRSVETIKSRTTILSKKLDSLKNIRLKDDICFLLEIIPRLLPDEAWIKNLNILYTNEDIQNKQKKKKNTKVAKNRKDSINKKGTIVLFSGYVYAEDIREQFRIVNRFIRDLKTSEKFSGIFDSIKLNTATKKDLEGYQVTFFDIKCQ